VEMKTFLPNFRENAKKIRSLRCFRNRNIPTIPTKRLVILLDFLLTFFSTVFLAAFSIYRSFHCFRNRNIPTKCPGIL
jgi:hypothetical protein